MTKDKPLLIGLRAARANLVPGLCIQAAMVALVVAYYKYPPAHDWFAALGGAKKRWGILFTIISSIIAGAVLPALFKIVTMQRGRLRPGEFVEFLYLAAYWGTEGTIVDFFYRFQAVLFGSHADVATVVKKVLLDQFVFTPFFATPVALAVFEFMNHGYRWKGTANAFTRSFYRNRTVPALIAGWGVWIPLTGAIYSLPSLLQIPLFALALAFWALILTYISSHQHEVELARKAAPIPRPAAG